MRLLKISTQVWIILFKNMAYKPVAIPLFIGYNTNNISFIFIVWRLIKWQGKSGQYPKSGGAQGQKKPGRQPMTAEEREAAAKLRAAEKEKADNLKPVLILQYQGADVDMAALAEAAKADFRSQKKRTLITDLKLYVKPEEHTAYYVINGSAKGKVSF